jgi:hypothetical protein
LRTLSIDESMRDRYLEVMFRKGRFLAAYLYLPRRVGVRSTRTEHAGSGIPIDFGPDDSVIGIELTPPGAITVDAMNAVLTRIGQPRASAEEMAPLRAAWQRWSLATAVRRASKT